MAQLDPIPLGWQQAVIRKEVSMREVWWILALAEEAAQGGRVTATMPPSLLPACRVLGLASESSLPIKIRSKPKPASVLSR